MAAFFYLLNSCHCIIISCINNWCDLMNLVMLIENVVDAFRRYGTGWCGWPKLYPNFAAIFPYLLMLLSSRYYCIHITVFIPFIFRIFLSNIFCSCLCNSLGCLSLATASVHFTFVNRFRHYTVSIHESIINVQSGLRNTVILKHVR